MTDSKILKIHTTIQALGLKCSNQQSEDKKGIAKFGHLPVRLLANAVADVAAKLPQNVEELVDVAEDEMRLDADIELLLANLGARIWGRDGERTWLFEACDGVEQYEHNLVYEALMDRLVLKHHLRAWNLVKAFNTLRNRDILKTRKEKKAAKSRQQAVVQEQDENEATQSATSARRF